MSESLHRINHFAFVRFSQLGSISRWFAPCLCALSLCVLAAQNLVAQNPYTEEQYAKARAELVRTKISVSGVQNKQVLQSILDTPRHHFVPRSERHRSYYDMALPIGHSQTISSPFIVALMTEALDPQPTDKVLEIGTGSGYQAAVLSPIVEEVYSIEIVPELGEHAAEVLSSLDYDNVKTKVGDGYLGWPSFAPFDKIIVTCSPEKVPQPLIDQLVEGGMMVIPVGERYQQSLYRMVKVDGKLEREVLRPTLFVPMTGTAEDSRQAQPDPKNPKVINGDFEIQPDQSTGSAPDVVPGWYYGRQVKQIAGHTSDPAPSGKHFARFENETPGLNSHVLQGIAIDGQEISMIRLSGQARTESIEKGPTPDAMPAVAISLYDEKRRDLGTFLLGPFRGTRAWRSSSRLIRIPPATKEAILRIGLFGATGRVDFDDVKLEPLR